jgi:D-alanyl-D-alanine endopeptidase (penicillin-binding protein 7)
MTAAALLAGIGAASASSDSAFTQSLASLDPDGLRLASVHAAVAPLNSDDVLYSKYADRVVPIASVTKLMMAMVVLDGGQPLDEWVTVVRRREEAPNNAYSRIRIGSELRRGDLLRIALMSSENRATYVLAAAYPTGIDGFIKAMNEKARALGMTRTHFADPTGLSPHSRSTASDLLKMVKAAYGYRKIREYTTTDYYTAHFRSPHYSLRYGNTDPLVHSTSWQVLLSKTGYLNEAGRCLVVVTRIKDRPIAMVFLDAFGTRTPLGDVGRVRRWIRTGHGGSVAGAALRYERQKTAQYEQQSAAR